MYCQEYPEINESHQGVEALVSVRRSMAFSFGQRYLAFIIQLGTSMIMARLLTPSETGIFSIAVAVVSVAGMLRDFGVSEYVIQEKNLTNQGLRAALGLTVLISWTIAALLFSVAGLVAEFYKEPGILQIIYVLVFNFVFLPLGTMTFAVMNKEMAFKSIFWVQTISNVAGSATCIGLAYHGYSYMSMAWSSLVGIATSVIILAIIRPRETFMLPSFQGLGTATKFGGMLTIGRMADQICRRIPDFLIGNFLGFHFVGIYSKAVSLTDAFHDFFTAAIGRVALPAFAKDRAQSAELLRTQYLKATRLITIFPLAFYGFCGLFANPIILFMFGDNWLEAVPVVQIGCIGGIVGAPYLLSWQALTANGQIRKLLWIQIISALIFLPAIYAASHFSIEVIALAGLLSYIPRLLLIQKALRSGFELKLVDLILTVMPSYMIAAAALICAAPAFFLFQNNTVSALLTIATGAFGLAIAGLVLLFLFKHPIADEMKMVVKKINGWVSGIKIF